MGDGQEGRGLADKAGWKEVVSPFKLLRGGSTHGRGDPGRRQLGRRKGGRGKEILEFYPFLRQRDVVILLRSLVPVLLFIARSIFWLVSVM